MRRLLRRTRAVNHLAGGAWKSGRPNYGQLIYRELRPGIDMAFRGEGGTLKYEFQIRPGADPDDIRLDYAGAEGLSLGTGGSLAVHTALGELRDARPVSYQQVAGRRVPVESRYALQDGGASGHRFAPGSGYDRSRPLVIDPGLAYSTFLGGTGADAGNAIAVDEKGRRPTSPARPPPRATPPRPPRTTRATTAAATPS